LGAALIFVARRGTPEPAPALPAEAPLHSLSPHGELIRAAGERPCLIRAAWEDETFRPEVLAFFGALSGSEELAALILDAAFRFNIPPALAFALCWEESRYNPRAANLSNRNKTVDRGLFQLNSASFSKLSEADFFDPAINAYYGMSHLRWCLDSAGSEVAGLAMYNAGTNKVHAGATPKQTLDYVGRIQESRREIEDRFQEEYGRFSALKSALAVEPPPESPGLRLTLLSPLGRR
jgi:hypothetical protein